MSQIIDRFLAQLKEQRARGQDVAAHPPPVEQVKRQPLYNALRRGAPPPGVPVVQQAAPASQLTLGAARERILGEIVDYAASDDERVLLLRVPPGVGKSYMAVQAMQELTYLGRAVYTASRKDFWDDLASFPIFDRDSWWNWLAIQEGDEEKGTPMTCRVAEAMKGWAKRGYLSIDLCRQLCFADGWVSNCEYRKQAKRKEDCIFARHNHLTTGLAFQDMHFAVVDELPLSAFLRDQFIPSGSIVPKGTAGPVTELFELMQFLVESAQYAKSRDLLEIIGDCLGDVYAQVEVNPNTLPEIPLVSGPEDVDTLPYNYWADLLLTLAPEYECWKAGWADWVPRIKIRPGGVRLLGRLPVWEKLPTKTVMLDATGDERIARAIFGRPVHLVECSVERKGRFFQVVGRQNGIGTVRDAETGTITRQGRDMIDTSKLIRDEMEYRKLGIITFKKLVGDFELEFGAGNVLHYGGQRGTNAFVGKDAVILCGAPNWPLVAILDVAAMLFPNCMKSFSKNDDGEWSYPWHSAAAEYRVRDGERAWRYHAGFWKRPELRTIMEASRTAEVVQGAHRGRPILYPCDVWILTSIPTPLDLDGIYQDTSELWFTPDRDRPAGTGIGWQAWMRLREWLDAQWKAADDNENGVWLTAEDLAVAGGVSVITVRRQKWVSTIADFSEKWHLDARQIDLGRPRLGIQAVEV